MRVFAVKNINNLASEHSYARQLMVRLCQFFAAGVLLISAVPAFAASSGGAAIHSHVTLRYGDNFSAHASIDVMVATRAVPPSVHSDQVLHTAYRGETVDFRFRLANQSNGLSQYQLRLSETHVDLDGPAEIELLDEHNVPVEIVNLAAAFTNRVSSSNTLAIPAGSERGFVAASDNEAGTTVEIGEAGYRVIAITPGTIASTTAQGEAVPEVPSLISLTPLNNHPPIAAGALPAGTHLRAFRFVTLRVRAAAPTTPGKTGYHRIALAGSTWGVAVLADGENGNAVDFFVDDDLHAQVDVPSPVSQFSKRVRNVSREQDEFVVSTRDNIQAYAAPGEVLEYELRVNALMGDLVGVVLADKLSPFVQYQAGTLTLNGSLVEEGESGPPLFFEPANWQVHSEGAEPGTIRDQQSAIIRYRVQVNIGEPARRGR